VVEQKGVVLSRLAGKPPQLAMRVPELCLYPDRGGQFWVLGNSRFTHVRGARKIIGPSLFLFSLSHQSRTRGGGLLNPENPLQLNDQEDSKTGRSSFFLPSGLGNTVALFSFLTNFNFHMI